jgi:hypothetical protein
MPDFRVRRTRRDDLPVERLGFGQTPGLVVPKRHGEHLRDRIGDRDWHDG